MSRVAIVGAATLALLAGLAALCLAGWAGMSMGLVRQSLGTARASDLAGVIATCWLLFAAAGGIALAIAAWRRTSGSAAGIASGVLAASFALDFVARTWQPIQWSRPLSIFAYYSPQQIVAHGVVPGDVAVLAVVAAAATALAFVRFQRRDL